MKQHIPNIITLSNLFLGCCAVVSLMAGEPDRVPLLILLAALADFADGLVARLLNVQSELGKQLDSLADVISFGFVPGAIVYYLLGGAGTFLPAALPAFIITAFAAFRLGKFNIDTRQSDSFIGLPTPACTLFFLGLLLIYLHDSFGLADLLTQKSSLFIWVALFSWLMVAEIPMFSFKFKRFQWAGNEIKFIFAGVSLLLLPLLGYAAVAVIVLLYIILSIILYWTRRKQDK